MAWQAAALLRACYCCCCMCALRICCALEMVGWPELPVCRFMVRLSTYCCAMAEEEDRAAVSCEFLCVPLTTGIWASWGPEDWLAFEAA